MDADDLRLFEDSLRRIALSRAGHDLDAALDEVGWRDALLDEPVATASVVFSLQGELGMRSSAIDDVVVTALGAVAESKTAVVLPWLGSHEPPGELTGDRLPVRDVGTSRVRGVGTSRVLEAQTVIVVVSQGHDQFVLEAAPDQLNLRPIAGMDPNGGWVEITADLPAGRPEDAAAAPWSATVTVAQLAIASELVAVQRSMLALARDHAVERIQFGRPIASFQAVRHRLADALLAVESAEGATAASCAEPSPFTAAMAKAIAGRSAKVVARHSQQVLAGMGFTTEHRFHHYLRRSLVLNELFGSGAALSEELGNQVLSSGTLPPMLPL